MALLRLVAPVTSRLCLLFGHCVQMQMVTCFIGISLITQNSFTGFEHLQTPAGDVRFQSLDISRRQ